MHSMFALLSGGVGSVPLEDTITLAPVPGVPDPIEVEAIVAVVPDTMNVFVRPGFHRIALLMI